MEIPWLTHPPTAEEVAAHAKAHPFMTWHGACGLWLRFNEHGPDIVRLWVGSPRCGDYAVVSDRFRWLPCTAEGIPVYLLPVAVAFAECIDVTVKAMQLFAVAQSGLVDFLRERGVTGNLDALALEMLTACAVDAPSLPEGDEGG